MIQISRVLHNFYQMKFPAVKLLQPSQTYLHSIALKQSILQIEKNFKTPNIKTIELLNDSEYLNRLEILWEKSAK